MVVNKTREIIEMSMYIQEWISQIKGEKKIVVVVQQQLNRKV